VFKKPEITLSLRSSQYPLLIVPAYLFLTLQLFVRISLQLSSPGEKSNPQEGWDGPLDEEYDESRFLL
jgi:hypothetical protein